MRINARNPLCWLTLGFCVCSLFSSSVSQGGKSTGAPVSKSRPPSNLTVPNGYKVGKVIRSDFDGDGIADTAYTAKPPLLGDIDEEQSPSQKPVIIYIKWGRGSLWHKTLAHYYDFPLFDAIDITGDGRPEFIYATQDPKALLEHKLYYAFSYRHRKFQQIFGDGNEKYQFHYLLATKDKKGSYLIGINFNLYEGEGADPNTPLYWYGDFYRWNDSSMQYLGTRRTNRKYARMDDAIPALKNVKSSISVKQTAWYEEH